MPGCGCRDRVGAVCKKMASDGLQNFNIFLKTTHVLVLPIYSRIASDSQNWQIFGSGNMMCPCVCVHTVQELGCKKMWYFWSTCTCNLCSQFNYTNKVHTCTSFHHYEQLHLWHVATVYNNFDERKQSFVFTCLVRQCVPRGTCKKILAFLNKHSIKRWVAYWLLFFSEVRVNIVGVKHRLWVPVIVWVARVTSVGIVTTIWIISLNLSVVRAVGTCYIARTCVTTSSVGIVATN